MDKKEALRKYLRSIWEGNFATAMFLYDGDYFDKINITQDPCYISSDPKDNAFSGPFVSGEIHNEGYWNNSTQVST